MIFCLAKILRAKKFRQTDNLCALSRRVADKFDRAREIFLGVRAAAHLDEGDFCLLRVHDFLLTPGFRPVLTVTQPPQPFQRLILATPEAVKTTCDSSSRETRG